MTTLTQAQITHEGEMKRRFKHILSIAVIGILLVACDDKSSNSEKSRHAERQEALKEINKPVQVTIANRVFGIPRKYTTVPFGTDSIEGSVFMKVVYPDFTSVQDFVSKEDYDQAFEGRRFGGLYLADPASKVSIPRLVELRKTNKADVRKLPDQYGLESFEIYENSPEGPYLYSTIHVEKADNNQPNSFIRCHPEKEERFPQCSHMFIDKGVWYNFSYNKKKYFGDWRNMRNRTINFIDSLGTSKKRGN